MRNGDFYSHYKGVKYYFDCIALPLDNLTKSLQKSVVKVQTARYHEDTHDLNLYQFDGITFIDSELPHVIYQSEKDYDTNKVYAREVDEFFGYKLNNDGSCTKRFSIM